VRKLSKQENDAYYDLIISDINMPRMDGMAMSKAIMHENDQQSIIIITAHNEFSFLHEAIKIGIDGFLTKPLDFDQLKIVLFKTTRAIYDNKLVNSFYKEVEELNIQLQGEKAKLEEQIKLLNLQLNATNIKHLQVGKLLHQQAERTTEPLISEYFAKDEDEGAENVLFLRDDCDELSEIFHEMPELLMQYTIDSNRNHISKVADGLLKASSILLRYTPFIDPLAQSFGKLASTINDKSELFVTLLEKNPTGTMMLYDAIGADMDSYLKRFSVESMAMKNIHHIHSPTTLSIEQIIGMISPEDIEEGEMEFF